MTNGDHADVFESLAGHRHFFVDVDIAAEVRRSIGPTAWAVIEVLASRADVASPRPEVRCSARALADDLGLSKDTTARALRSLARQGFIRRLDHRAEANGRFAATTYEVELAAAGLVVGAVSGSSNVGDRTPMATPAARWSGREQPSIGAQLESSAPSRDSDARSGHPTRTRPGPTHADDVSTRQLNLLD